MSRELKGRELEQMTLRYFAAPDSFLLSSNHFGFLLLCKAPWETDMINFIQRLIQNKIVLVFTELLSQK